jgi:hypothetical protein
MKEESQQTPQIAPEAKKAPAANTNFFSSIWADIVGAAITIAVGATSGIRSVHRTFYQNLKVNPKFKELVETSKSKTVELLHQVEQESNPAKKRLLLLEELPDIHSNHERAIADWLKKDYAIGEKIFDKIKLLRPHQRREALNSAFIATSVALGAVGTAISLRELYEQNKDLEGRLKNIESKSASR